MPGMTLLVHRLLSRGWQAAPPGLDSVRVSFTEGESLGRVLGRAAEEDRSLGLALCGEQGQAIRPGILVVLNNRILNRMEVGTVEVRDGDEVTFLPIIDGG